MRHYPLMIRSLLGVAATVTLLGCQDEPLPVKAIQVGAQAKIGSTPSPMPSASAPTAAKPEPVTATKPQTETETATPAPTETETDLVSDARKALDAGELERALKLAKLAVSKEPRRSAAFNTLGRAHLRRGQHADAIKAFGRAVELNPQSTYAHNNLGLVLLYDGKYEEAAEHFEAATSSGGTVEGYMWNNLGMAYEHLDMLEDARLAYGKAVEAKVGRAKKNLARLQGVTSIRTAQADIVDEEQVIVEEESEESLDGGVR